MNVALRIGNFNALLAEAPGDFIVKLAFEDAGPVDEFARPDAQIELHGAVGKVRKQYIRLGIFEHPGIGQGNLQQKLADPLRIFPARNTHGKVEADAAVRMAPVDDRFGNEL